MRAVAKVTISVIISAPNLKPGTVRIFATGEDYSEYRENHRRVGGGAQSIGDSYRCIAGQKWPKRQEAAFTSGQEADQRGHEKEMGCT